MKFNSIGFLSHEDELKYLTQYSVISEIITDMHRSGTIAMASGNCISGANMIYSALKQRGIDSHLVEVELTITWKNSEDTSTSYIGFDNVKNPGELDTHVVVIANIGKLVLIDASISRRLPATSPVVVDIVDDIVYDRILMNRSYETEKGTFLLMYREKKTQKVAEVHFTSIVDRINTDKKIFDKIENLKVLNYIGIVLSLFALINILWKLLD